MLSDPVTVPPEPAEPVRWEPCWEPHADDAGLCAACGWPVDDHRAETTPARRAA
jgi:hypothetical protein